MLQLSDFYPNPVPGFIVTGIVCASFAAWAIIVALVNFGPWKRREPVAVAAAAAAPAEAINLVSVAVAPGSTLGGATLTINTVPRSAEVVMLVTIEKGPDAGLRLRAGSDRGGYWGRAVDNQMVVTDTATSRRHARFEYRDGAFLVTDLGTVNGSLVNGQRGAEARLQPGDRVQIGQNEFVVTYA